MTTTMTKGHGGRLDAELERLGVRAEALRASGAWREWLGFRAKFHDYSPYNVLLIWSQRPDATMVMGFRKWGTVNRFVRRGEHAIRILAPVFPRRDGDEGRARGPVGFRAVSVFDVAQTDGEPLPTAPPWPTPGPVPAGMFARLVDGFRPSFTVRVEGQPERGTARGYCSPARKEVVVYDADEARMVGTLLHEAGHMHDPALTDAEWVPEGSPLVPEVVARELVAESVAWLLAQGLGVEMADEVDHYLASWEASTKSLLAIAKRVGESYERARKVLGVTA